MSRFTYLDCNRFILFIVKVAFLGWFGNLWRRLVDDDMSDAGDGASATEDAHVAVLPGVHEPDNRGIYSSQPEKFFPPLLKFFPLFVDFFLRPGHLSFIRVF